MIIAPAKNILFGEHAVVYPPNTAIIAANNLECKAEAKKNYTSSTLEFEAAGTFTLKQKYDFANLLNYLSDTRNKYQLFLETKKISVLNAIINKKDDLLKLAVAVALDYLNKNKISLQGFSLYLLSEVPAKSGFGSSAVFSSAVIAAILDCFKVEFNKDKIFELTMEIEGFQHGTPSGEGPAAVIFGGLIKLNKNETSKPKITKLPFFVPLSGTTKGKQIKNEQLIILMNNLMIVNSGTPTQSTGELVAMVRNNKNKDSVLNKIEKNTQRFLQIYNQKDCAESDFIELINNNGRFLEELGLIIESAKTFCEEIRNKGGAAKISGAGGCDQQGGSGALLVYHSDRDFVKKLASKYGFEFFDIQFGSEGIRKV